MDELSASEALFGFAGWLTARDEQVVFSARDHAALAAELVAEFCKVNGLAEPRQDWTTRLTMPPTSALTQGEAVEQMRAALEAADQSVQATMLDDGQIFKMPEPKVIARGHIVWDDPQSG